MFIINLIILLALVIDGSGPSISNVTLLMGYQCYNAEINLYS